MSRNLTEVSFARCLVELLRERFNGAAVLTRERLAKRFQFHEGLAVFAESNLPSESLGMQLLDAGRITRADYAKVVARVLQTGCKEGNALLELGALDAKELFQSLREQVRRRLLECFGWPRGELVLDASAPPSPEAQPFRVEPFALLQDGLEQHWSQERILADLEPRLQLFPVTTKLFARVAQRLRSDDAVQALFDALDGRRNFWRALQLARTPRSLSAAWVLDACGALHYRETPLVDSTTEPSTTVIELVEERIAPGATASAPRTGPPAAPAAERPAAAARGEDDALAREIRERCAALDSLDHYALLGVAETASLAEIKKVYLVAARRYHPDALAREGLSAELRSQAGRLFAAIGKAHAVLIHPEKRAEYDAQRSAGDVDANALANAEVLYRKGELLMRTGNFQGALEYLQACIELWPDEAAYQSALGWALYKKLPSEPQAAKTHLERALELAPNEGMHLFRLGVLLRSLGEAARGQQLLERARKLDPSVS
jgi:tetratricopeptide (TPR) repeat protein